MSFVYADCLASRDQNDIQDSLGEMAHLCNQQCVCQILNPLSVISDVVATCSRIL